MNKPRARWLMVPLLLLAAPLLIALLAGWWLLHAGRATLNGNVTLPGLQHRVTIERDALGTVTLTGATRDDLSYALGYVHAQERFFPMDLMRRLPAGELSALVGKAALQTDIGHRQERLRAVAEAAYAAAPAEQRHTLDRYRDGVNAGLAQLRGRPWEYWLLGQPPQPWRSEDSLLVLAAMYLELNGDARNQRELDIDHLHATLPKPIVDFLLAPDPAWEAPLQGPVSPEPVIPGAEVMDLRKRASLAALPPQWANENALGSNSFAVAGSLTRSGGALLANDMHLGLRVPDIWFRTRLRYPDSSAPNGQRDAIGVSLPGTPVLVVGSNGQIAWGFTNSAGDWLDWVRVQRDPANPQRYRVPQGWAPLQHYDENIAIKGAAPYHLQVEETRWGPIIAKDADGTPLALAWIGHQPHGYNLAIMQLERTASTHVALDLAPSFGMPPQNLLVADRTGHIGWTIAGNAIPLRSDFDPSLPADWSQPNSGWLGWASAAQYPRVENPAGDRLWTANNRTVGGDAFALLGNGGQYLGARAQQIRDDLQTRDRFGPGNTLDIQLDDHAVFLTRWQQLLQNTLADSSDPQLQTLRQLSANWRNEAAPDSVDYRLVRAFREQVHTLVLAPFLAPVQQRFGAFTWPDPSNGEAAVWALLQQQPAWLLDPRFKNWHALLLQAAQNVVQALDTQPGGLAARRWGEVNHAGIDHPLARVLPGVIAHWLNMPDDELPGDANMPRIAAPGFGASERFDVVPGHEAEGILEMPGGQSDNPLSPFYGAGHEDWVHGRPTPLLPGASRYVLRLEPARQEQSAASLK